jgi:flagellar hook-associated protein 1 FlgK
MAGIINTGISALSAFKRQMETTGHNIANVNTEGYSRQRVHFGTRNPETQPQGFIGSGVEVTSIQRSYDAYLASRVRSYNASYTESSVYEQRAKQIDSVIADSAAGLDSMLQQFFGSVNDVADDPSSIPTRSVMINRANQLVDRFNALDGWFNDIRNQLNRDLEREANEINSLASALAKVNTRVAGLNGNSTGVPNDVLDERDRLVDSLSRYSSLRTVEQNDGAVNVFIGTGQALVVGNSHSTLSVRDGGRAAGRKEIFLQQGSGAAVDVTAQMTGGSLGGLLRFRSEVLDASQNALGRVAIGLTTAFNTEHRSGMDFDGDLGGNFFTELSPAPAHAAAGNAAGSGVSLAFADIGALTGHEYDLRFDGASWTLRDLVTGSDVSLSGTGTPADPLVGDGISITVSGASAGDSYLLRPTHLGAGDIGVVVNNARDIAAGEAVLASAKSGNLGTGRIDEGAQTSTLASPSKLVTPLTLQFDASANRFDIYAGDPPAGAVLGSLAYDPATDAGSTLTVPASITGLGDYSFSVNGTPADTDRFVLADNTGAAGGAIGTGDNRNARRLADLQSAKLMIAGTATLGNAYGALVADVGTRTHQAANNASVQERLLTQASDDKARVSGVNLDEEAADLVRFQQAYQAAAQVINVASTLFDSLLGAVRR